MWSSNTRLRILTLLISCCLNLIPPSHLAYFSSTVQKYQPNTFNIQSNRNRNNIIKGCLAPDKNPGETSFFANTRTHGIEMKASGSMSGRSNGGGPATVPTQTGIITSGRKVWDYGLLWVTPSYESLWHSLPHAVNDLAPHDVERNLEINFQLKDRDEDDNEENKVIQATQNQPVSECPSLCLTAIMTAAHNVEVTTPTSSPAIANRRPAYAIGAEAKYCAVPIPICVDQHCFSQ
ncbi:hypothetical protein BDK51DRAFT_34413 [Blyttiomyces helicus]|uniref:Uncharacterized protein n=1 Tax=Blyttiomyces helicus TaxID=388810 RepID=A0A4P9WN26_9FUNG|nr:hypothetical protein BDK51DRAFT_34413 [Blyttiomyces helicus]|eukprot:RKO93453.1 hypothetical protein BDK51DRAFT_34413 [Blyttiomyces helicus]